MRTQGRRRRRFGGNSGASRLAAIGLLALVPLASPVLGAEVRWRIDPVASEAGFAVRVLLIRRIGGQFHPLDGHVTRNLDTGLADVEVRIDSRGLGMRNPDHAEWARSAEFFDVARHPWIHFQSAPFEYDLLQRGGPLIGSLTLRGITASVHLNLLPSECARPGFDCPVRAEGDLDRRIFGMTARRFAVADRVQLSFAIWVQDGSLSSEVDKG